MRRRILLHHKLVSLWTSKLLRIPLSVSKQKATCYLSFAPLDGCKHTYIYGTRSYLDDGLVITLIMDTEGRKSSFFYQYLSFFMGKHERETIASDPESWWHKCEIWSLVMLLNLRRIYCQLLYETYLDTYRIHNVEENNSVSLKIEEIKKQRKEKHYLGRSHRSLRTGN